MNRSIISLSRIVAFLLCIFSGTVVLGQGESNYWYFGAKAGLNFNTATPTLLTNGSIDNSGVEGEGCSAISDAGGNLLFYTDGVTIYNRTHAVMTNGNGLMGDKSSTQTAIIALRPGSTTQYYIFTSPITNGANQIRYSIVDMTLSGGLGAVTATKNVVMPGCAPYMMEALTSVPTNVTGEYWIIAHRAADRVSGNSTSDYYAWKITSAGVAATPVISSAGYALPSVLVSGSWVSQGQGFIKSNTCYTKIFASYFAQGTAGRVDMLDFNKTSGAVSGTPIIINNFDSRNEIYSIEISPNDRYLYVTELGQGTMLVPGDERVHQFDLNSGVAATINASRYTLMTSAPTAAQTGLSADFVRTGHLQLAPNGKIYVSHHSFSGTIGQLSVIDNPNNAAPGFQHYPAALRYPSGIGTTHGLPQFPRNFVAGVLKISGPTSACMNATPTVSLALSFTFSGTVSSQVWSTTGGGTFSSSNTIAAPTVTYTTAGVKRVKVTVTDICSNIYVDSLDIDVRAQVPAAGTISCTSPILGNVTSPNAAYKYVWYSDAAANNALGTGTTNVPLIVSGAAGNVYLKAVSTSSSSSTVNNTLRAAGAINTWGTPGVTTVNFTVINPITMTAFDWGNGTIPGWPNPSITYTVRLQNAAGTTTYYTGSHTTPNGSTAYNMWTETFSQVLAAGNYRLLFSNDAQLWNATTVASDANVNITGNPGNIGNFKYSTTSYSTTDVPCSVIATVPYNCSLPVTWLTFDAARTGGTAVTLNWSTSYEENSEGFNILRSIDGENFEVIGFIKANGNSTSISEYQYIDVNAPTGSVYYKLVEQDFDGITMNSPVRHVSGLDLLNLFLVPNPGNGNFKIVGLPETTNLTVTISSITGQEIATINTVPGELIELGNQAKGVYLVKILLGSSVQTIRFINQ